MAMTSLQQSLFNRKTLAQALASTEFQPSADQLEAASGWAQRARHPAFQREKEVSLQGLFKQEVVERVLGYRPYQATGSYSVAVEEPAGAGAVDLALGDFNATSRRVLAPFELKGPAYRDLDAIMPGRAKTPVQQAWDYATDLPGSKWVLVSNLVELRLYAFGYGRNAYEVFALDKLDQADELKRFWLLLGAENLLSGHTGTLLEKSARADKDITDRLYLEYKTLRERLIDAIDEMTPELGRLRAIDHAQTILDRVLFIAFAEHTGLLPEETIRNALMQQNDFVPIPLWDIFKGLFQAIDKGNPRLNIPPYNGGLFAPNPEVDHLSLPDEICREFERLASYDYKSEVSVQVLGHIFEQSISDIEAMQAQARGEELPGATKKKREGVVYTPDFVTRFIVEQTIGRTLREKFSELLTMHSRNKELPKHDEEIRWKSAKAEREFWEAYQSALRRLTVVDPACGSGAFLIAAFDYLALEYRRVNERLADLRRSGTGQFGLFDPDREILTHNLYGVDVNAASVEITKLSLWIKTAKRGKALDSLEANIRVGNSLIEDADYHHRAFVWRNAFPQVFAAGGFDIVLGNPPYVRMELIKPFKPYLEKRYEVVADRADLYAYFFEHGVRLLKPGGRLGYISSSTFFRTGSGKPLRRLLSTGTAIETVVDFGDLQVFEGVTTYPAIVTLRRLAQGEKPKGDLRFMNVRGHLPDDLTSAFHALAQSMPLHQLREEGWAFEGTAPTALREKVRAGQRTLEEVYGQPLYGIKTGLNDAFVIDRATRDRLVAADARAELLLKPFLRGEDIKRWRIESDSYFLINIPKGKIDVDDYPSIRDHLLPFKTALEGRATRQKWFELQQAQLLYQPKMAATKIMWPHFQSRASFCLDQQGYFLNNKAFFIPDLPLFELAFLNSSLGWFILSSLARIKRGGFIEAEAQYVGRLPSLVDFPAAKQHVLTGVAKDISSLALERAEIEAGVRRRIPDLCPAGREPKLTARLHDWWSLDFATFRAEVKKAFKQDMPLVERNAWEAYLTSEGNKVRRLTAVIDRQEREIDCVIFELFDLTGEEIRIVRAASGTASQEAA